MRVEETIVAKDIEPTRQTAESLIVAACSGPETLTPADLPWARLVAHRMHLLVVGYQVRRRQRLEACLSHLQVAATDSVFQMAIERVDRHRQHLLARIARCDAAGGEEKVIALPRFVPRADRGLLRPDR